MKVFFLYEKAPPHTLLHHKNNVKGWVIGYSGNKYIVIRTSYKSLTEAIQYYGYHTEMWLSNDLVEKEQPQQFSIKFSIEI